MKKIFFITLLIFAISCKQEDKKQDTDLIQTNEKISENPIIEDTSIHREVLGKCYEQKFGPQGKENIFRVNLIEKGKEVTGLLEYIFFGEQPIAGTIIGQINDKDEIHVLFSYTQEGVPQYQKVYFKKASDFLIQRSGELIEEKGILDLKDKRAPYTDTFLLVPCTNSFL